MQIFVTIIVMIVMLGILISTHELGHLAVAKAYNVYCLEYSIGIGPAIFKHKKKGAETTFAIRAIPLGGYVSMYGEGLELPEGQTIPRERSIEGIKWWKRCLVFIAGISVNLLTSLLFCFVYATAFPNYYTTSYFDTGFNKDAQIAEGEPTARAYCFWTTGEIGGEIIEYDFDRLYAPEIAVDDNNNQIGYVIDCDTKIINGSGEETYVAVFNITSVVNENDVFKNTKFYRPKAGYYADAIQKELHLDNKPDIELGAYTPKAGDTIVMTPTFIAASGRETMPTVQEFLATKDDCKQITLVVNENGSLVTGDKLKVHCHEYWLPFGQRLANGCYMFKSLFTSIGEGLKYLFSGHIENIGSIVAAGGQVLSYSNELGWIQTFFFYGGFLALNLAIFNLLPFPGLDGYQLLVVLFETVFHKKIPEKVKNIISLVGVVLLFGFSIFIVFRDIVNLF